MMSPRKDSPGTRAYAGSLFWVVLLIAAYWVLAEWPELPRLLAIIRADLPWPV